MTRVMNFRGYLVFSLIGVMVCSAVFVSTADGQDSSLLKLLAIRPRQTGVEYDQPSVEESSQCTISKPDAKIGKSGYVVVDGNGRVLRQFLDNNADDRLDQWSYYKDGIEVYRDLDTNFDNKADQYRWMGTAGLRWGLDRNQDGTIDSWRMISAEEVASEIFEAIKTGDIERFRCVLISPAELKDLGLGEKLNDSVIEGLKTAVGNFRDFSKSQRLISKTSEWVHFGTSQPNLVAAGNNGSEKDIVIYDHASAVFRNGGDYEQVAIGTVVQVAPNSWRAAELPQIVEDGKAVANGGILFPMPELNSGGQAVAQSDPADEKFAKLFSDLDKLEKQAESAKKQSEIETLEAQRARLKVQLVDIARKEDRVNWIESLADSVTDAYQRDRFPDGLTFLASYQKKLQNDGENEGLDYIAWRMLNTKFSKALTEGDQRKRAQASDSYMQDMEDFVGKFERSQFTPECLHNLGMYYEVADMENPKRAIAWYGKCAKSFPTDDFGKKSKGAVIRLTSEGKPVEFVGKTIDGRTFDLSKQKKIVVLHYWESQNQYCTDDFDDLKRIAEKYKDDVIVIGANIDRDTNDFQAFMNKNPSVSWTQLHEPGGIEKSPLAQQFGPASLPLIVLLDTDSTLVESGLSVEELDREIQRLIRKNK